MRRLKKITRRIRQYFGGLRDALRLARRMKTLVDDPNYCWWDEVEV